MDSPGHRSNQQALWEGEVKQQAWDRGCCSACAWSRLCWLTLLEQGASLSCSLPALASFPPQPTARCVFSPMRTHADISSVTPSSKSKFWKQWKTYLGSVILESAVCSCMFSWILIFRTVTSHLPSDCQLCWLQSQKQIHGNSLRLINQLAQLWVQSLVNKFPITLRDSVYLAKPTALFT